MCKPNIFEITFTNFQGVFHAGQSMQGHLTVELEKEMSIRGIRLKFEGSSSVRLTESNIVLFKADTYYSSEKYFEEEMLLFGIFPGQGNDTDKLAAGRTTFPFCFVLPPNLPSSFEGTHGSVKYSVEAIIDRPWKLNHTKKRSFTIIGIMDLNAECLCCGEPIKLLANINNNSNKIMKNSYVELKMITTYHTPKRSRTSEKTVRRVVEGPIEEGQSFSWDGQMFVVPPLPPSYLLGCRIIDIKYTLELNVEPSSTLLNLKVPLDIIIGTIPLHEVVELCPPRAPQPLQPQTGYHLPTEAVNTSGMDGGDVLPPAYLQNLMSSNDPNLPPHSYRKCVIGKWGVKDTEDNENTQEDQEYAPMYTYYDWGYQPTTMR